MAAEGICRCFCGDKARRDQLDPRASWGSADVDVLEEVDESPFQTPQVAGRISYSITADQPLRGAPIREGELWWLSTEDRVDQISFSLHVNGFSFMLHVDESTTSVSLSPFALVRNCKFQSSCPNLNLNDFKIFKVSLFAQGVCYYFGVKGGDERQAEDMRLRWVLDISQVMRVVTQSVFPPFNISVEPLVLVPSTERRLMAGYLLHHNDGFVVSVLYCELHPHCEDKAKLAIYENEACQIPVMDIYITERSICCEKVGINCSCFSIEEHQFSTRTLAERKLWLRAISNLKVKLQNRAPIPSTEDLCNFRSAIQEHLATIKPSRAPSDPLLQRCLWRPRPTAPLEVRPPPLPPQGESSAMQPAAPLMLMPRHPSTGDDLRGPVAKMQSSDPEASRGPTPPTNQVAPDVLSVEQQVKLPKQSCSRSSTECVPAPAG